MNLYSLSTPVFQLYIDEQPDSAFSRLILREFEFKNTTLPLDGHILDSISNMISAAYDERENLVEFKKKSRRDYTLNVSREVCEDFMRRFPLPGLDAFDAKGLYARIISALYVQKIRDEDIDLLASGRWYDKAAVLRSFENLRKQAKKIKTEDKIDRMQSICSNSFFKEARLMTSRREEEDMSPWDRWLADDFRLDNVTRDRLLNIIGKKKKRMTLGDVANSFESKAGATYQWPIYRTIQTFQYIYSKYQVKPVSVLDPCGGWGDRLAGFLAMDFTDMIVNDTNPALMSLYRQMFNTFKLIGTAGKRLVVLNKPAEELELTDFEPIRQYECVHSGLPYGGGDGLELYDGENGSSQRYQTYNAWKTGFLEPTIMRSLSGLVPGGIICINVDDCLAGNIKQDMCNIFSSETFFYDFDIFHIVKNNNVKKLSQSSVPKTTPIYIARYRGPVQPMGNFMLSSFTSPAENDMEMDVDKANDSVEEGNSLLLQNYPASVSMMSGPELFLSAEAVSSSENNFLLSHSEKPKKTIRKETQIP